MKENNSIKAPILGISRLRMGTDGKGITTLIGFYGCPLNCAYCINDRCHRPLADSQQTPDSKIAMLTPKQLFNRVKKDNIYFQTTGGGVCFGGGEPTLYTGFITQFQRLCGQKWNIFLETSLYGITREKISRLAPIVEEWIIDIKEMNPDIYRKYTGRDNSSIYRGFQWLREFGLMERVSVTVPKIPRYNTDEDVERSIERLRKEGVRTIRTIEYMERISEYPPKIEEI